MLLRTPRVRRCVNVSITHHATRGMHHFSRFPTAVPPFPRPRAPPYVAQRSRLSTPHLASFFRLQRRFGVHVIGVPELPTGGLAKVLGRLDLGAYLTGAVVDDLIFRYPAQREILQPRA